MKNTLFRNEWKKLENYYKKAHTRDESNFYYSKLKDLNDDVFLKAIDSVYKKCKYFPNIAEIREQASFENTQEAKFKEWENVKRQEMSESEFKEIEELFKEFKN